MSQQNPARRLRRGDRPTEALVFEDDSPAATSGDAPTDLLALRAASDWIRQQGADSVANSVDKAIARIERAASTAASGDELPPLPKPAASTIGGDFFTASQVREAQRAAVSAAPHAGSAPLYSAPDMSKCAMDDEQKGFYLDGHRIVWRAPADCSADPSCCPENEGHGCHCGYGAPESAAVSAATKPAEPVTPAPSVKTPEGFALVPIELTPEMKKAGGHSNSEWLNDYAPIGEARYAMPMDSVWAAMLAAAPTAPIARQAQPTDEQLRDAIAEGLRGLYGCGRVWSAWSVGTMGEDDFYPADESDECIDQVFEAIRALKGKSSSEGAAS
jgi:hypothetical protein